MSHWTNEEKKDLPVKYGCELIYSSVTIKEAKDYSLPNDGYLVYYKVNDELHMDVCRGNKRVDIFDLYYDKFGPNSVQKIDFGYGRTNPKLWNYKSPDKKKKK
jgi:hypothetical protein